MIDKITFKPLARWECNLAAVWGQMSTGGGHSQLEETMSIVEVPVMTRSSFIDMEKVIGEMCWHSSNRW